MTSDEGYDLPVFWVLFFFLHNFGSGAFTFFYAFDTMDFLTGDVDEESDDSIEWDDTSAEDDTTVDDTTTTEDDWSAWR